MNFSGYIVLVAATFFAVLVQNSEAGVIDAVANYFNINKEPSSTIRVIEQSSKENEDAFIYPAATELLKASYINSTLVAAETENIMNNGIEQAKALVKNDPESAKKAIQQARLNALLLIFASGGTIFGSQGGALSLSSPAAREGMEKSNVLLQNAGFAILDILDAIEYIANIGLEVGGDAAETLLESIYLALKSGYAGVYLNVKDSIQVANEALRYARNNPFLGQSRQYCQMNTNDPDARKAINEIIIASNSAMSRGSNPELIQKLMQVVACAIIDFVNITAEGKQTMDNIRSFNGIEPLAVKITFFKQAEALRKSMSEVTARIYLILGEIALRAGKLSSKAVNLAFVALEKGQVEVYSGINSAGNFLVLGQRNKGNSAKVAIEAASRSGLFAKKAYLQEVVNCVNLALSVL